MARNNMPEVYRPWGKYYLDVVGDDVAEQVEVEPLAEPVRNLEEAQCKNGILFVSDVSETALNMPSALTPNNYHGLDYPLFHMDIRENVALRVRAFLGEKGSEKGAE